MTTKKQFTTPADLRSTADAKAATWRELAAEQQRLTAEYHGWAAKNPLGAARVNLRSSPRLFEHLTRELAIAEAAERAGVAEREAVLALDAAELAEGLEDARLRHLAALRDDALMHDAEIQKCQQALTDAQNRYVARVDVFQKAQLATSQRRRAAGLPVAFAAVSLIPGKPYAAAVDVAIAKGIPLPGFVARVASLKGELIRCAADLEEAKQEEEAEAKDAAREKAWKENLAVQEQKRIHAREKTQRDERDAERRHREQLAADHLRRVTGGAA